MSHSAELASPWTLSPARALWQAVVGWGFTAAFALFSSVVCIATLGLASVWLTPALLRFWGRTMLRIMAIELEVEGWEHLRGRSMRVATFNHTSLLDAILIPVLNPEGGVSAIKREALYLPFVGVALWAMGFLLIDRGRTERARRVLRRAAERMERERLTVFIAPEGTRSRTGELQPFKKGAFHLAVESGAPIVPIVIVGANEVYPMDRLVAQPGVVHIRVLPPIETKELTLETMGAFAESLHALYLRELAALEARR